MQERVQKLRALLAREGLDGLLVTNSFNRRYITGFTGTAGVALITGSDAVFITDFRYVDQARDQAQGYTIVKHNGQLEDTIAAEVKKRKIKRLGFEQDHLSYRQYTTFNKVLKDVGFQFIPVSGLVEELRRVKDEQEIEHIRQAVAIVDRTYAHILNVVQPGMTEIEVAHEIEFFMRKQGATSSAFDIIVASGVRSALPHGVASGKIIEKGDFVTLDFGAYYQGYVSDMTRTFAVGEPDPKLKEIYAICLEAQLKGVESIKAGMTGKEADAVCRDYISARGYGDHFGHSTGHGIGLEVHEGPTLSVHGDLPLKPGMVVTVEPGIYLSGVGGVRIEDDVLITEQGNEILTQSPKELIIIE
ncbi:Xaa-Pro aminopeptidase [Caldalkalibacillus uzonensis]|uniref:Xaa-Pro aminopeptidase n=1 Tax=Caldalkalibacillus uzonensis TaxID=353224 RepID=A0ABU0CNS7_9BACI|nr:Xaa-Pro peptidase family protein [Caldalkalibacillus uzonensis]MDQ0337743.1 Xaa-Pro aminopeptidase [Caldalkalibacillus uzonensis]